MFKSNSALDWISSHLTIYFASGALFTLGSIVVSIEDRIAVIFLLQLGLLETISPQIGNLLAWCVNTCGLIAMAIGAIIGLANLVFGAKQVTHLVTEKTSGRALGVVSGALYSAVAAVLLASILAAHIIFRAWESF